ncbi:MAG: low molecular weight phosphotyrosine protein phosphatase [Bacteroidota bacterium]|nr:MAG: low molecular weight phosphotyrosine protein phosphatase [Bacteroidota bacterium]
MKQENRVIKILFICMGNICRSPSAEAVMNFFVANSTLSDIIQCDSAGTLSYHAGEPADARMQRHASKRGYELTSISRQVRPADFNEFDYVVAMDDENVANLQPFLPAPGHASKISKMTNYCSGPNPGYVPDPYYGGSEGFEQVLDLLEDACQGLLTHIRHAHQC